MGVRSSRPQALGRPRPSAVGLRPEIRDRSHLREMRALSPPTPHSSSRTVCLTRPNTSDPTTELNPRQLRRKRAFARTASTP